jgi:hypothetical protein
MLLRYGNATRGVIALPRELAPDAAANAGAYYQAYFLHSFTSLKVPELRLRVSGARHAPVY